MARRKPERDQVEKLLLENRRRKAYDIAEEVGLVETMGEDKAVDYVRRVLRSMRKAGAFPEEKNRLASEEERLEDITKLFELRQGKTIDEKVAYLMLMLNCFYRYRSQDDDIHWGAIDDTYAKNQELEEPLPWSTAIDICKIAQARYMQSINEQEIARAKRKGLPYAGFCFASDTLIRKLAITDEELQHMKSIKKG